MLSCELDSTHKIDVIHIYNSDGVPADSITWSKKIGNFLASNSNLVDLQLRNDGETTFEDLENILRALEHNNTLQVLRIVDEKLPRGFQFPSGQSFQRYAEGLAKNTSLAHLELYNVKLRGGIRSIADALQYNATLKILSFNDPTLTNQDLAVLKLALFSNTTIETLQLSDSLAKDVTDPIMALIAQNNAANGRRERNFHPSRGGADSPRVAPTRPVAMQLNSRSFSNIEHVLQENLNSRRPDPSPGPKQAAPKSPPPRKLSSSTAEPVSPVRQIDSPPGGPPGGPRKLPVVPPKQGRQSLIFAANKKVDPRIHELWQQNETLGINYRTILQENEELTAQNHKLRLENEQLHSQLVTLALDDDSDNESANIDHSQLIDTLQMQIQMYAQENDILERENDELRAQKDAAERQLHDSIHQSTAKIAALQREIDELKQNEVKFQIPYRDITFGQRIGEGGFGEVVKATWLGQKVAVKKIKMHSVDPAHVANLIHESKTMTRLHHKHIVLSMGTTTNPNTQEVMLVMEYMKHGSLDDLLFRDCVVLDRQRVIKIALDVAKGMHYLHSLTPKIMHRDLKCANILLYDNRMRAKISDFGTAKVLDNGSIVFTSLGTPYFMAPEILADQPYTIKADVYSFGVILFAMMTNTRVPMLEAESERMRRIRQGIDDHEIAELVAECCSTDPNRRPFVRQIIDRVKMLRKK